MCEYEETREAWRVNAISYEVPHSLESLVAGGGAKVATLHRRGCVGCPEEGSRCRPFSRFFTKPSTHNLVQLTAVRIQCHEAKRYQNANGHFEGPIDFFDQSF